MKLSLDDWDRKIANPCAKYPSPFTQTLEMPIDRALQEVKGSQDPSPTHTDGSTLYRKRLRVYTLHHSIRSCHKERKLSLLGIKEGLSE